MLLFSITHDMQLTHISLSTNLFGGCDEEI